MAKTTKAVKTAKAVKKDENEYKVTVRVLGKTYEATGATVSEALLNLNPQNCKGVGVMVVSHGDVKKERILAPATLFRLFNTAGMSKQIAIKNVSILFQGI